MISINSLEKIYRTEEVETVALSKLSIEIKEGEFVAIMGPSGCGKSTLLNILGLLDDQDGGSFVFNGIEVSKFNERKRADLEELRANQEQQRADQAVQEVTLERDRSNRMAEYLRSIGVDPTQI